MNVNANKGVLVNLLKKHEVLIASHRGSSGGHIFQNTIPAYKNAIQHGAHIIEIDLIMSRDGVFYALHDGNEHFLLGISEDIRNLSSDDIDKLRFLDEKQKRSNAKLDRFEDIIDEFKHDEIIINVDRAWFYWKEIIDEIIRLDALEQVLLKSHVDKKLLQDLQLFGSSIMYMPIIHNTEEIDIVENYDINTVGYELIFEDLESDLIEITLLEKLKNDNKFLWANAITLDDETFLAGEYCDNHAIKTGNFEKYWGGLINLGFNIIQTDWPGTLAKFIEKRKGEC